MAESKGSKSGAVRPICPYCHKRDRVVGMGAVVTVSRGPTMRYKCGNCGHTFYPPEIRRTLRKSDGRVTSVGRSVKKTGRKEPKED